MRDASSLKGSSSFKFQVEVMMMTKPFSVMLAGLITAPALAAGLSFTAPEGWKPAATSSSMRVAQFVLPRAAGDSQDAELVVYYFGGSGGTIDANIDRWVAQMQQPAGAKPARAKRTVNGLAVTLVDVSGTYVAEMTPGAAQRHNSPNFRLRAGVVETPNGPYFIKLTGPAKTVAGHEARSGSSSRAGSTKPEPARALEPRAVGQRADVESSINTEVQLLARRHEPVERQEC